ncbi:MAG: DUF481 domain-containing protein [Elusimicrobia bacterium]|nr:DUF481 domain-containing protein [Elusimicrobiota bacterium]
MSRWILFALLAAPAARAAEETPRGAKAWKNALELSLLNATGNSRTTTYGADDLFTNAWEKTSLEVKAGALGTKSQGATTAEQYNASEKVQRALSGAFYAYELLSWTKNRFAGIRNRYESSIGAGAALLDSPRDRLTAELGSGYTVEERVGSPVNRSVPGRLYGKYVRTLSPTASVSQDAEYLRRFSDGGDYRLSTETAATAALNAHLSLKASYKWKQVNRPPAGFVRDDTVTALALIVNY